MLIISVQKTHFKSANIAVVIESTITYISGGSCS